MKKPTNIKDIAAAIPAVLSPVVAMATELNRVNQIIASHEGNVRKVGTVNTDKTRARAITLEVAKAESEAAKKAEKANQDALAMRRCIKLVAEQCGFLVELTKKAQALTDAVNEARKAPKAPKAPKAEESAVAA